MTSYIGIIVAIICLLGGLIAGVAITIIGFKLGFRASYEIRGAKGDETADDKSMFSPKKEPAEFDLLVEDEEEEQEDEQKETEQ